MAEKNPLFSKDFSQNVEPEITALHLYSHS